MLDILRLNRIKEWNAYPYNPVNYKEYGLSTYNYHSDGAGICHASHRRPLFNLRPGYITLVTNGSSNSPCSGLRHFQADSHLISWLHNKELDYEIVTDEQLHEDGYKAIKNYKTIITGTHPEYHTKETLDALTDFRDNGGSLNYLGGNGFYWRIAIHKENKSLLEIRRPEGGIRAWASEPGEAYNAFDGTYGGLWRRSGRAPQELVGIGFTAQGNFYGHSYERKCFDPKFDWIFKGIKENKLGDFGFSGNGAAGFELDHIDSHLTSIKDITLLAQSKASKNPEENFILVPESRLTHLSNIKHLPEVEILQADMVYFEVPGGGSVFSTGSITFCGSLPWNNYNNNISKDSDESKIKPIIGCELNVCVDHLDKSHRDDGYQIVFLAKNKNGYQNLSKMCSLGYTKGFYYVPRIDKKIVEKYKEDLIVLSGNMYGEIAGKILNVGETQAEDALVWWKSIFNEDFYLEMMRHGQEDEDRANEILKKFAHKYDVQIVPTNNSLYINKEDANAHDILLCVKDGEKQSTPIGRGRGFRYGLPNQEYYFKSPNEMKLLFKDMPNSIENILDIVDKIDEYDLAREVLLPKFNIPSNFSKKNNASKDIENDYLKYLTYQGAKSCYDKVSDDLNERILFELNVIKSSGYPGYFLIVQDLIRAAKSMGVSVGPGRGSAAGSVVAYCLGITKVDPIK